MKTIELRHDSWYVKLQNATFKWKQRDRPYSIEANGCPNVWLTIFCVVFAPLIWLVVKPLGWLLYKFYKYIVAPIVAGIVYIYDHICDYIDRKITKHNVREREQYNNLPIELKTLIFGVFINIKVKTYSQFKVIKDFNEVFNWSKKQFKLYKKLSKHLSMFDVDDLISRWEDSYKYTLLEWLQTKREEKYAKKQTSIVSKVIRGMSLFADILLWVGCISFLFILINIMPWSVVFSWSFISIALLWISYVMLTTIPVMLIVLLVKYIIDHNKSFETVIVKFLNTIDMIVKGVKWPFAKTFKFIGAFYENHCPEIIWIDDDKKASG